MVYHLFIFFHLMTNHISVLYLSFLSVGSVVRK